MARRGDRLSSTDGRRSQLKVLARHGVHGADATTILDKFTNLTGAPLKARTDLEPSLTDLKINITDVTSAIDAFTGDGYPFEPMGEPWGG
jgi:hypothetical protein